MTEAISSNLYQCPICGEKEYILVTTVAGQVTDVQCLSCGYDGSHVDFTAL